MSIRHITLAAITIFLLWVNAAAACKGSTTLFEEDFSELDAGWLIAAQDVEAGTAAVGEGRLRLSVGDKKAFRMLHGAFKFTDLDICVTTRFAEVVNPANAAIAIIFWANDYSEFYSYQVSANGSATALRLVDQNWEPITRTISAPSFRKGDNEDNEIRLVIQGQTITSFINDTMVGRFRAPAPSRPTRMGLSVLSFGNLPVSAEFRRLKITSTSPP